MKNLIALLLIAGLGSASCGSAPAMPDTEKMQAEADAAAAAEQAKAEAAAKEAEEAAKAAMVLDVVDTALAAGNFTTLAQALTAAELIETLKGEGPFTVFAPTDEAFAKLDPAVLASLLLPEGKEKLKAILTYHVVAGKVMAADVAAGEVATVNGANAAITVGEEDGAVTFAGANVTKTDIDCTNGVIHVIDTVVMPPAAKAAKKAKK